MLGGRLSFRSEVAAVGFHGYNTGIGPLVRGHGLGEVQKQRRGQEDTRDKYNGKTQDNMTDVREIGLCCLLSVCPSVNGTLLPYCKCQDYITLDLNGAGQTEQKWIVCQEIHFSIKLNKHQDVDIIYCFLFPYLSSSPRFACEWERSICLRRSTQFNIRINYEAKTDAQNRFFLQEVQTLPTLMSLATGGNKSLFLPFCLES